MRALLVMAAVLSGGCGLILGIGDPSVVEPDAAIDAATTVTFHFTDVHRNDTAVVESAVEIAPVVYVPDGDDFQTIAASTRALDPTLAVPPGDYWVRFADDSYLYCLTGARELDLGTDFVGRRFSGSTGGTTISLHGTNLSPAWASGDELRFSITNLGYYRYVQPPFRTSPAPTVGATTIDATVDWAFEPRVDSASGDQIVLAVYGTFAAGGLNFFGVRAAARTSAPLVTVDGVANNFNTTDFVAPPTRNVSLDWKRSQFQSFAADMHPMTSSRGNDVLYMAQPVGTSARFPYFQQIPEIAYHGDTDMTDLNVGTVPLRNPFPGGWIIARHVTSRYTVTLPMGSMNPSFNGLISTIVDVDAAGATAAPIIGPPRNPTLNGRGAFADAVDVGLHPILAWSPPTMGTPNRYQIRVWHYASTGPSNVHDLIVPARITQIRIPPGVMQANSWNVFEINAISTSGDPETAPGRATLPFGRGGVVTSKFAVGAAPF
jgi:hypothetical protein